MARHGKRDARTGFVCAGASQKSPGILRILGSLGFFCRAGSFGFPTLRPPGSNAIWEFYPISADMASVI
jgi:hypothetical protein